MKKNSIQSVQKIVKAITKSINIEDTMQAIADEIVEHLTSVGCTVFLAEKENRIVRSYKMASTITGKFVLNLIGKDVRSLTTPYDLPLNNIGKCIYEKKAIFGDNVVDFVYPTISKSVANTIQIFGRIKKLVAIPIIMQNEVLGAVLLAFNNKNIESDKEKIEIMHLFMDHVAIAINNALKYEQLQKQYNEMIKRYEHEKTLSAMISHELRTPISVMSAYIEAIKDFQNDPIIQKEAILNLEKANKKIYNIVNNIITTTNIDRNSQLNKSIVNLCTCFTHLVNQFIDRANFKNLKLKLGLKIKDNFLFSADFEKLEIAFKNILENAIKYTNTGYIKITVEKNGNFFIFKFKDTGIGIPKEDITKIFDRFYRVKKYANNITDSYSVNMGLGLYIAKGFIEAHNGTLEVEKSSPKGTTFVAKIPIA